MDNEILIVILFPMVAVLCIIIFWIAMILKMRHDDYKVFMRRGR